MKNKNKPLYFVSSICCFFIFIQAVSYTHGKDEWSPIDEYAHMDYVEKITEGRFPKLTDSISEEIYQHIISYPEKNVHKKAESRHELGLGNFSYQAQHPPVYYFLLSIPDWIMKQSGVPIFSRLMVLRIISCLLIFIGSLLIIPIGSLMRKSGYYVPEWYTWGAVIFCMIVGTNGRYGLGNNALSPLMINLCIYYLLKYRLYSQNNSLYRFVFFSGLAICTALTNLVIIPFLVFAMLKKYISVFKRQTFIGSLLVLSIPLIILYIWKIRSAAIPAYEKQFYMNMASLIPAGAWNYKLFIGLLLNSAFKINFTGYLIDLSYVFRYLFLINFGFSLLFFKTICVNQKWIIFIWISFLIFAGVLLFLNACVGAVTWSAFRHYLGFMPFIYVAGTSFVLLLIPKIKKTTYFNSQA